MEADVHQGQAGGAVTLDLGDQDHGASVTAAPRDEHVALLGDSPLRADEPVVALDARRHIAPQTTAIDDLDRGCVTRRVTFDPVTGEPDHRLDRGVEIGQYLERAIGESIAACAGGQDLSHEHPVEDSLVAS